MATYKSCISTIPSSRRLLTTSRPYQSQYERSDYLICEENQICQMMYVVYRVVCAACDKFYMGEIARLLGKRMDGQLA